VFGIDREVAYRMANIIMAHQDDNMVSIIYNLLRCYLIKRMIEQDKGKNNHTLRPTDIVYDDGHLKLSMKQFIGIETETSLHDFNFESNVDAANMINITKYTDQIDVDGPLFHTTDFTQKEFDALLVASSEWTDTYPYRICHTMFRAADNIYTRNDTLTFNRVVPSTSKILQLRITC